jgi:hypothetical protein
MPTDGSPSVKSSVIMAFAVNIFQICEMPTDFVPSVWTLMIVHCSRQIMFVLPIYYAANT